MYIIVSLQQQTRFSNLTSKTNPEKAFEFWNVFYKIILVIKI